MTARDEDRLLLRAVEVAGHHGPVDVLVSGGRIVEVGLGLRPAGEVQVVDGAGGALLPGLHDHHVHLLAMAARAAGLDLDPLPDADAVDRALRAAATLPDDQETVRSAGAVAAFERTGSGEVDSVRWSGARAASERTGSGEVDSVRWSGARAASERTGSGEVDSVRWSGAPAASERTGSGGPPTRWVRAAGYDEHRHGPMGRDRLDALAPGVAVRVQHRSGLGWVLSSAALVEVGVLSADGDVVTEPPDGVERDATGRPTGWLHRLDAWLGERVPPSDVDLAVTGRCLAACGITGVTDATVALGPERTEHLRRAVGTGDIPQRVVLLGVGPDEVADGWARVGPAKLLADEALGLDPVALAADVAHHHARGRAVAIHAVTRAETITAVAALAEAGTLAGDRIEHGSVLPSDLDPFLAAHRVTVVVQPSLVAERGDHHLAHVDADDLPFLHRHASLVSAGVPVGVGSDAPVTSADPWAGVVAASTRQAPSGTVVGPDEAVDPRVALGWYLADPSDPGGPPRRVAAGARADLCLLDGPLVDVLSAPSADRVRATWVGGRLVHG